MINIDSIKNISGIGDFETKVEKDRTIFQNQNNQKAFLIFNKNTLEIRSDYQLIKNLTEKFESVMQSRYFGRGGLEIVLSNQLPDNEIEDLIRLSYNLTAEIKE